MCVVGISHQKDALVRRKLYGYAASPWKRITFTLIVLQFEQFCRGQQFFFYLVFFLSSCVEFVRKIYFSCPLQQKKPLTLWKLWSSNDLCQCCRFKVIRHSSLLSVIIIEVLANNIKKNCSAKQKGFVTDQVS